LILGYESSAPSRGLYTNHFVCVGSESEAEKSRKETPRAESQSPSPPRAAQPLVSPHPKLDSFRNQNQSLYFAQ